MSGANGDNLHCLIGQLGAAAETCRKAMEKLVDHYSSPDVPDDVKRSLKYICELQLGEVLQTVIFWHRELPNTQIKDLVGGVVHLAYYHTGFIDDPPILLDVCDSQTAAGEAIDAHKEQRDPEYEYEDAATWWTETRGIRTAHGKDEILT